jgi:pimeloyl-ACP methyl ester carboxylesterase
VQALVAATGARFAFGHSSGALIVLRTALSTPAIERIALYEPPLSIDGSAPTAWLTRFDREVASGKLVAAMITALKGLRIDPILARVPRFVLRPVLALGLRTQSPGLGEIGIADLIPTHHFDMQIVREMADTASEYARLPVRVLLLGGARSPAYVRTALEELGAVLPHQRRVSLPGVGHEGPENDGRPGLVAQTLHDFFTAT